MEEKDSYAAALKKAREIAAKMQANTKVSGKSIKFILETDAPKKSYVRTDFDSKKQLAVQIATNLSRRFFFLYNRLPKDLRVFSEGMDKDGNMIVHLMIPTILVCLFGGRDNETIRWMQEKTGVRMDMNLEHKLANSSEKPLTIIGEPDNVEAARELVKQYIREKDDMLGVSANNMQVSLGLEYAELLIPKEAVGLVIGKQGENIKKVNNETGCMVKFRPLGPRDDPRFQVCTFQGTASQVKKAREQLTELVEYLKQKFGLTRPVPKPGQEFVEVRVSATKAGVVIGKGGENIKQINNLSGAIVCIDRSVPDGSDYRTFFVVGTHDQVEHAKYLIREKSGEVYDMPDSSILALNPLADPYFNQAPIMPLFAAPLQPSTPSYPTDSGQIVRPPLGAPVMPAYVQPQYQQQPDQDYTAAWNAYYQQYYQNCQPPTDGSQLNSDQTAAYWQQYYQYYQQNPQEYQQYQQEPQTFTQLPNSSEQLSSNHVTYQSTESHYMNHSELDQQQKIFEQPSQNDNPQEPENSPNTNHQDSIKYENDDMITENASSINNEMANDKISHDGSSVVSHETNDEKMTEIEPTQPKKRKRGSKR